MPLLNGYTAASVQGNALIGAISANLDAFAVDYWPAHVSAGAAGAMAPRVRPLTSQATVLRAASLSPGYLDDFYNRIHVVPLTIAVGNLVTSQQHGVEVWNAYLDATHTVTAVDAVNASGIVVTAPAAYPMDLAPRQSRNWVLDITTEGSPTIDASFTWQVTGLALPPVTVTGDRVTPWTLTPDWTNGISESLRWLTDLQVAIDGSSQRVPLRDTPRREWEFDILASGAADGSRHHRELMESALGAWRGRVWAVPVWADQLLLAAPLAAGATSVPVATAGLDFVDGGLALLYTGPDTYDVLQIDTVAANALNLTRATSRAYPAGTRLWPMRLARLTDTPRLVRGTANLVRTTVRFRADEPCDWTATAPATIYRGFPVLESRPDVSSDPTVQPDRHLDMLDGDIGGIYVNDPSGLPWWSQGYAWWLNGRTARSDHRALLYWLAGRAQALWLPSYADDITLVQALTVGGNILKVAAGGFARFASGLPGRQHIRIERTDGSVVYRAITAMAEVDADTEQLSIDSPLASDLAPGQVRQISFMMLAHLGDDQVQIDHLGDSEGVAHCRVAFNALPAEEPAP